MSICSIENCGRQLHLKGYCSKHYQKFTLTPERLAWRGMKNRCYKTENVAYKNYGGRGITVCDEWLNDFKAFHEYIGDRPSKKYSVDRIDNECGYEPGNVRWATKYEQSANRRNNNETVGVCYRGVRRAWRARLVIDGVYVLNKEFKSKLDAINARLEAERKYHNVLHEGATL